MSAQTGGSSFQMSRIGRHTLVYGLGMLLTKGVSFIMLPVYTRYLTPADYGVMELIGMTLDIIAIVAGAKLALGVFRFYHKAETQPEKDAVVSTTLAALALSYGMVGLLAFLAAGPLSTLVFGTAEYTRLIRIAAATLALQSLIIVPFAYARVRDRSMLFVAANVAKLFIALSLNIILLVHLEMGVEAVFWANLVSTAVVGLALTVHMVREVGIGFSRGATRDLLRYGVPLIGTQCAAFLLTFGDRYFLQSAGGAAAVGLYSLAYQFGFLLAAIGYIPFETVWEPARFDIAKRPDRDAVLSRGFRYVNLVLLSVAVGLSLFVPDLLRVMATPEFHAAAALVPLILVAYVLQGWTQIQDIGILVRERTELHTVANWVAAGVAMLGYALLIPVWLGMGAALATVIAFGVRYALIYTLSQRLWPVRYEWAPVVRLAVLALVIGAAGIVGPGDDVWVSLAFRTLLFACYLGGIWHLGILSDDDRALVRSVVRSPRAALATLQQA